MHSYTFRSRALNLLGHVNMRMCMARYGLTLYKLSARLVYPERN